MFGDGEKNFRKIPLVVLPQDQDFFENIQQLGIVGTLTPVMLDGFQRICKSCHLKDTPFLWALYILSEPSSSDSFETLSLSRQHENVLDGEIEMSYGETAILPGKGDRYGWESATA